MTITSGRPQVEGGSPCQTNPGGTIGHPDVGRQPPAGAQGRAARGQCRIPRRVQRGDRQPTPPHAARRPVTPRPRRRAPTRRRPHPVSFAGVTLQNHTGGYSIPAFEIGLKHWKAETGGNATFTNIPFDEKPVKIAGMIATQDSSWDLQYTYDNFMQRFGARLLDAARGQLHGRPERLHSPSPSRASRPRSDQVLRGLPIHFSTWLWDWNANHFTRSARTARTRPTTYDGAVRAHAEVQGEGHHPVRPAVAG